MPVGSGAAAAVRSFVAFRQETTYGVDAVTTTAHQTVQPISLGFQTTYDTKKLETLNRQRAFTTQVQLNKNVSGELETYLHAEECSRLLINALGGTYTFNSLTSAGDHSITAGNFATTDTITSFSIAIRKGDALQHRYLGSVINKLKISAAVGEPVKVLAEFICQDSTNAGADIGGSLSFSTVEPFTFAGATMQYDSTEASLTSTVAEPIQGFELEINNNIVSDEKMRQLGTRILSGRPAAMSREVSLKITQRYDTTTAYSRMDQNTAGAINLVITGPSISAEYTRRLIITFPNVRQRGSDPMVEGADQILQSEHEYDVIVAGNSGTTTSREIGMTLRNAQTTVL